MANKNKRVFLTSLSLAILLTGFSQSSELTLFGYTVHGDGHGKNQDDLELVEWVVIYPVKGDKFPIAIFPNVDLDIIVESSWDTTFVKFVEEDPGFDNIQFI